MERRLVLTSLAALAATPVLAQSNPSASTGSGIPADPQAPVPAPAMKALPPLSPSTAIETHLTETMAVGALSLVLSRIAEPKVKQPMPKQFAGFEIAEQETVADILNGMKIAGGLPGGSVTSSTDAAVMGSLDPAGKASVEKLRAMKAGPDFDKAYIKVQVDVHRRLLLIQDTYLSGPDDAAEASVAKLMRGMIKEHLTLLIDLGKAG